MTTARSVLGPDRAMRSYFRRGSDRAAHLTATLASGWADRRQRLRLGTVEARNEEITGTASELRLENLNPDFDLQEISNVIVVFR
jgi:hypothetical protein